MTEAQAVILAQQFDKLVKETDIRRANADYLSSSLGTFPGITPVRLPDNSRPAWHLYAFRYDAQQFNALSRDGFARAVSASRAAACITRNITTDCSTRPSPRAGSSGFGAPSA